MCLLTYRSFKPTNRSNIWFLLLHFLRRCMHQGTIHIVPSSHLKQLQHTRTIFKLVEVYECIFYFMIIAWDDDDDENMGLRRASKQTLSQEIWISVDVLRYISQTMSNSLTHNYAWTFFLIWLAHILCGDGAPQDGLPGPITDPVCGPSYGGVDKEIWTNSLHTYWIPFLVEAARVFPTILLQPQKLYNMINKSHHFFFGL